MFLCTFSGHFLGKIFLIGFAFTCRFYLCFYFEIFIVSLRDEKDWPELSLRAMYPALRVPPGGNQVDGLPPVVHTAADPSALGCPGAFS